MRLIHLVDQENKPYSFLVLYRNADNWDFKKITDQYGDMIITHAYDLPSQGELAELEHFYATLFANHQQANLISYYDDYGMSADKASLQKGFHRA